MTAAAAPALFAATGIPLHTRALSLELLQESATELRALGTLLDLRKCGFVPTGGDLQTAGFVHHMHWDARLRDPSGRIEQLAVLQPVVAMEASEATGGECCRDPAPRLQALVGTVFDAGFAKRLATTFGGPLGCSHLLTLGQALGALVPSVLADLQRDASARKAGERVAKRAIVLDGFERSEGRLGLTIQLADYRFAPFARAQELVDRLAGVGEVRLWAEVGMPDLRLLTLRAALRERDRSDLDADWRDASDAVSPLVGGPALRGMALRIRERLGSLPASEARVLLGEALLQLAPGLIQCMAALSHRSGSFFARAAAARQSAAAPQSESLMLTSGGMADSCYMWRTKPG